MLKRNKDTSDNKLYLSLDNLLAVMQVQTNNLHAAHWNLQGCHSFMTFHKYLEELYDESSEHVDKIAEFSRIHGDIPIFTMAEYLAMSEIEEISIQESKDIEPAIKKAIEDSTAILKMTKLMFKETGAYPDVNDYMAIMIDDMGKRIWFLKSSQKSSK